MMKGRRMQQHIDQLKDHYILCGCGAIGREIVQEFHAENVPYVVVDSSVERAEIPRDFDVPVVEGDATNDEVLLQAGIERAKGLVSALHDDPQNVFVTLTARQLNPNLQIVARASEEGTESKLLRAGANRVISPFEIAGRRMAATVLRPNVINFLDVIFRQDGIDMQIEEVSIRGASELVGKTLRSSNLGRKTRAVIIAITDQSGKPRAQIASDESIADQQISEGDVLIAMGNDEQIRQLHAVAEGAQSTACDPFSSAVLRARTEIRSQSVTSYTEPGSIAKSGSASSERCCQWSSATMIGSRCDTAAITSFGWRRCTSSTQSIKRARIEAAPSSSGWAPSSVI